jgi:hypothetical protein
MLPFVERLALLAQALVLLPRVGVGHEGLDAAADALKLRLLHDGLAQFQSFLAHRVFDLSSSLHKLRLICGKNTGTQGGKLKEES